jgi:hypothetical protein
MAAKSASLYVQRDRIGSVDAQTSLYNRQWAWTVPVARQPYREASFALCSCQSTVTHSSLACALVTAQRLLSG